MSVQTTTSEVWERFGEPVRRSVSMFYCKFCRQKKLKKLKKHCIKDSTTSLIVHVFRNHPEEMTTEAVAVLVDRVEEIDQRLGAAEGKVDTALAAVEGTPSRDSFMNVKTSLKGELDLLTTRVQTLEEAVETTGKKAELLLEQLQAVKEKVEKVETALESKPSLESLSNIETRMKEGLQALSAQVLTLEEGVEKASGERDMLMERVHNVEREVNQLNEVGIYIAIFITAVFLAWVAMNLSFG